MKKPAAINTIIGTGIFLSIPLIFVTTRSNFAEAAKLFLSYPYWVFILFYLGVYFLLSKIVLPQLYFKGKFLALFFVLTGLLALAFFIKPFDGLIHHTQNERPAKRFNDAELFPGQREMPGPRPSMDGERQRMTPIFDFVSIFLLMMVCLIVVVDEAVKKSRLTERRAIQAEADKANAELSFLKAQINPHFLFNTLNNIYSLAVTKSDNAPDAIMKLSNIMRYITDEANETMVPLDDEISCINDYISLQKLRLGENFPIDFSVSGSSVGKIIPPLVLMTFVENAFKHGISNHEQSNILLKIVVQDKYIHFFAQNNLFAKPRNTERTGVGIANTKKRLQVLYAEKHLLMITEEKGIYAVELVLYS